MGSIMEREKTDGGEMHIATGKEPYPKGHAHWADWGEWRQDDIGPKVRDCMYPHCDLSDWETK